MIDALVLGRGRIGTALLRTLEADGIDARGVSHPFRHLPESRFSFLTFGINGFKHCEDDPREAAWVNVIQTINIAKARVALGSRVVWLSSAAAVNNRDRVYGALKLVAECGMLKLNSSACILRFGSVYRTGSEYPNGKFHPVSLEHVVTVMKGLMTHWKSGIVEIGVVKDEWAPLAAAS